MDERLELVKKAFDEELVSETMDFNALGWPERIGWLIEQAERVEELEERNSFLEKAHKTNIKIAEYAKEERDYYEGMVNKLAGEGRLLDDDNDEKARQALEEGNNATN
ncbi:hypothetical protein [Alkalibacillus salilacus]|uniref:Uncharacterized protein n=1 Tax=Alkalibacillus salilacus TaxID=284582 RepID=A0ABT9VCY7_9BACI|nr:hypothetical protein [Alkalibacillus salilacus]MDQ0158831.1 hypothetical protein [Alkalibacillus salilacus]